MNTALQLVKETTYDVLELSKMDKQSLEQIAESIGVTMLEVKSKQSLIYLILDKQGETN
jgi:RIO-like serine/threonine protein kinase